MVLSEFDIEYVDCKSIKGQVIADQLVEASLFDSYPIHAVFPDSEIMTLSIQNWKLYFDGSYT